ncbi:MAG: class B sortase [Lachnospiraceae bacterium]|nr:class B sortase [Lachnospiraceae bacterium]
MAFIKGTLKLNDDYKQVGRTEFAPLVFASLYIIFLLCLSIVGYDFYYEGYAENSEHGSLRERREADDTDEDHPARMFLKKLFGFGEDEEYVIEINDESGVTEYPKLDLSDYKKNGDQAYAEKVMLPEIKEYYDKNNDVAGWLKIDDTVINYPVMQTMQDEEFYIDKNIDKKYSSAGSLIMDTDSTIGSGTLANGYRDGSAPSTNLIIHGHNMKNGSMFGSLDKWRDKEYCKSHNIIKFSSLYEEREYEIVSVFLSQVYYKNQDDVFKYYNFFKADNKKEFDDFYINIKRLALYDTGVTAKYGDEFITLSVCAYHVENGRLAVVAKRIK